MAAIDLVNPFVMASSSTPRWASVGMVAAFVTAWVAVVVVAAVVFGTPHPPRERAIVGMGVGLMVLWCGVGGWLQRRHLPRLIAWVQHLPGNPRARFVLACTALALLEEAVTTAMTNTAPLFGITPHEAFITPSTNWLHTVMLHSVVVFVPMFATWAWWLGRRRFHAEEVFLLVGGSGLLAEWLTYGQLNPIWVPVYGLMAWVPARACAHLLGEGRARPRVWTYLAVLVLPLLAAAPVAGVMMWVHPSGWRDLGVTP